MRSYEEYLARHIPLAVHRDYVLEDRLTYEPLSKDNAFWEDIDASYGCQNRLTSTLRFFDVRCFDFYKEYGIKVSDSAFVLDAAGRVLTDSRLFLYTIVLGGQVTINDQILPKADGYHIVIRRGKGKRAPRVMQDDSYQCHYRREDFQTVNQLLAG
ncbi:hypothetical protein MK805_05495 [Shimazuella sp. AN120528]|uniref:hypothetical protein n=1 Tax=Shimazuella soli TaxID=1892854 RepID=UPI001F0EAB95|nr:hypothetical protein [Shimazuella soli]MCH5584420.1 hypothetical protein [Shimazuella soli]